MCNEEYEFWNEKPPRTVDDPEIVKRVLEKWEGKLGWRRSGDSGMARHATPAAAAS